MVKAATDATSKATRLPSLYFLIVLARAHTGSQRSGAGGV